MAAKMHPQGFEVAKVGWALEDDLPASRLQSPRYEGEDKSPTTDGELKGWYAYAIAAEVYGVCGVGSFLPVTLEQLARESGVLWSDHSTPCTRLLTRVGGKPDKDNNQCLVAPFGIQITTASFSLYTFSAAVFVQAIALISCGAVADYGYYRKKFLLGFAFTGATTSMLFLLVVPEIYLLGSLLVIIGVTCLGCSFTLLNSFLPLLVANHPKSQDFRKHENWGLPSSSLSSYGPTDNIRNSNDRVPEIYIPDSHSNDLEISITISSKGVAIGYASAVGVQVLSIIILWISRRYLKSSTLPLRLVLLLTGAWWCTFSIPCLLYLRPRPGPPLPVSKASNTIHQIVAPILFAWNSLFSTIKLTFKLKQVLRFLLAWFLLSDAIATVSGTAILFARTELQMTPVPIALLSVTATLSGLVGAFSWPIIAKRYSLSSKIVILLCIAIMEIIPLYGLVGYLAMFQNFGWGGLQQAWEIFPLAFVHGFVLGGLNSYCRSFFGTLIPPGREAAFYALYAVTDKGSSAVGPAIVGRIVDRTGGIRPAFWFLALLILLPLPLVWLVDVDGGKEDALGLRTVLGKEDGLEMVERDRDRVNGEGQESESLMRDHD